LQIETKDAALSRKSGVVTGAAGSDGGVFRRLAGESKISTASRPLVYGR
jgi:hypothetical protein